MTGGSHLAVGDDLADPDPVGLRPEEVRVVTRRADGSPSSSRGLPRVGTTEGSAGRSGRPHRVARKMTVVHTRPSATTWPIPTRLNSGRRRFVRWPVELTKARKTVASLPP